ncbi:MAG: NAD(+)/NADH kinase, partial [Dongia sp.]
MATPTFAFVAAPTAEAQAALAELKSRYGEADPVHAEILVVLGGDGTMLETLHRHMGRAVRIFGMNCGTVGFLMNR